MATDVEKLLVRLEVSQAKFERQMAQASMVADRRSRAIEGRFERMNKNVTASFAKVGAAYAGAFAAFSATRAARDYLDSSTRITNALKVAGLEGAELSRVYDRLFESAQRNSAPIESLVQLYSRVAIVQGELGVSSDELLRVIDGVGVALRVAGTDTQAASGALLQLSQAFGSGVVRAEEFSSIQEGALPILTAAAAGIKEAGGSVARLRSIMLDGKLSSEAFFRGIEAGMPLLEDMASTSKSTVSEALVRLQNVLTDTAGKLDEGSGASEQLSGALDTLANYISNTDFTAIVDGAFDMARAFRWVLGYVSATGQALGDLTGASGFGPMIRERIENSPANLLTDTFNNTRGSGSGNVSSDTALAAALAARSTRARGTVVDVGADVTPITLDMYPVEGQERAGRSGGRARRGGRTPDEQFARDVEQIRERTSAIQAETAAMGALNPLIDDYGYALEKTRAEQDLLTAAKRAGVAVTPELRRQIETLATGYATASVEANKLAESQDEVRKNAEDMQALGKDVMGGFIGDVKDGISATEALANALDKVGSKLLDIALDGLFTTKKGGGGGILGALGSLFGGRGFASGTANTGGRRGQPRGVVHGQEAVIPLPAGGKVPVDVRLPAAGTRGGGGIADVRVSIDQNGNLHAFVERVSGGVSAKAVGAYDRQLGPGRTIGEKMAESRAKNRFG